MKAFGIIGFSNSGKTTLLEALIPLLRARGLRVSAVKNAHHGFDMDRPGKDSFRFREAGADQVLVATAQRWALLTEVRGASPTLEHLLAQLAPCDLVLVEGFKGDGAIPKIELRRARSTEPPIFPGDPTVLAVAADCAVDTALPVFDLNDRTKIADFIVQRLDLARRC